MTARIRFLATLLFVVAVTAIFLTFSAAQMKAPKDPGGTGFEQEQAFATLSGLLKDETPHTAGSPANAEVRNRVVTAFMAAGYRPEIQSAIQCSPPESGTGCTFVENISAVHKGTGGGKAILATAHYDSVPAGPGVGDDLAGTAVMLELAGAMAARETKNDIIFLITDGEETGLRGAIAFAERHPLFKQVGIVVNVEARGASGPSMMFETGEGSARLMSVFAKAIPRPAANSLTYEVYKLLPNDTDFSIYRKKANLSGFNFAFSNSASLYHSENDNLENLNRNTLQHHGDNAFAIVGALADADLEALKSTSDASYFDVYARTLIVWPAWLNVPIALLSLLAIIGLIYVHREAFALGAVGWSLLAVVATGLLLFGAGWLLSYPLGIWPGVHPIDHPAPSSARIALAATGIAVPLLLSLFFAYRIETRVLILVSWLVLALLAMGVATTITGAAYPFMWPVAFVALAGWIETLVRRPGTLAVTAIVGFVMAAFFWLTFLLFLELVVGFDLSQYKILVLLPVALALTPVLIAVYSTLEARVAFAALLLLVAGAAWSAYGTPAYTPDHPRGHNIAYYDDRTAAPRWLVGFVGAPDEAYLKANGFPAKDEDFLQAGVFPAKGRLKPATDLKLAAPIFALEQRLVNDNPQGPLLTLRGSIKGGRGGLQLALAFPAKSGVQAISVAGQPMVSGARLNEDRPLLARLTGFGARDVPIEITFDPTKRPTLTLIERSALPDAPEAKALVVSRPSNAAPVHFGDGATVLVKLDLAEIAQPANAP